MFPSARWSLILVLAAFGVSSIIFPACKKKKVEPDKTKPADKVATKVEPPVKTPPTPASQPASQPATEPAGAVASDTLAKHMGIQLGQTLAIRLALMRGDLEAARAPAKWLAGKHEEQAKMPAPWKPHIEALNKAGKTIVEAKTLADSAKGVAEVAKACGDCHKATNAEAEKKMKLPPLPAGKQDAKSHMARHAWAVGRLWDGITGPSEYAWNTAAAMLAEAPLKVQGKAKVLAGTVHGIAKGAPEKKTIADRAALYEKLLVTCSGCHRKDQPKKN